MYCTEYKRLFFGEGGVSFAMISRGPPADRGPPGRQGAPGQAGGHRDSSGEKGGRGLCSAVLRSLPTSVPRPEPSA